MSAWWIFIVVGCAVMLAHVAVGIDDPYSTLGVPKKATMKEIKRAYKAMAKEWHPDKNDSPQAHEKFMAITRAYEILSDPLRKERYDKFGTFDEPQTENPFHGHPFDEFFGFGFAGFDSGNSFFQKHRISMRMFSNSLLERSFTQPLILFAYSGYCQLCFHLEPIWRSVVDDLEPLGYGIGTVNAITDGNLLERLRVSRLPSLAVVVEGRVVHYRGTMQPMVAKAVRLFARDVIPNTFIIKVGNYDGLRRFVDQWKTTNKISVLILGSKEEPRMRYMLAAMKYATFARFAYVHVNEHSREVAHMREALAIKCTNCESLLIFNDFPEKGPIARLSVSNGNQISVESMGALIESNKHLVFPRLASQAHLDELCPVSSRSARRLCVVLTVVDSASDARHVASMRHFVRAHASDINAASTDSVRFVYLFVDRQKEFILPFLEGLPKDEKLQSQSSGKRDVVVVWRQENNRARFSWLHDVWDDDDANANKSGERLLRKMEEILRGTVKLDYQAALAALTDEYRPSWFTRLSRAAVRMGETAWFQLTKEEALPVLSAVGTFLVILLIGYGLNYANMSEKQQRYGSKSKSSTTKKEDEHWHPDDPSGPPKRNSSDRSNSSIRQQRIMREMEPLMHELRAETYFGMIRLLKPGCRSIIILVDEQSKPILMQQFARYVWPIRNNKTFSFGYLMVNKNLPWFRKLLEHTLPVANTDGSSSVVTEEPSEVMKSMYERLKGINPRKTLGTVLVLCGWKLFFSMYHPMHTAPRSKHFLGFDDDDVNTDSDDDSDSERGTHEEIQKLRQQPKSIKVEDVLNGFPNWLDRLFEGSVRRYYIPEWPDNLK